MLISALCIALSLPNVFLIPSGPMAYSGFIDSGKSKPWQHLVMESAIATYAPGSKHAGYWFRVFEDGEVGIGVFNDLFLKDPLRIDCVSPGIGPSQIDAFRWATGVLAAEGVVLQSPAYVTSWQAQLDSDAQGLPKGPDGVPGGYDPAKVKRELGRRGLPEPLEY